MTIRRGASTPTLARPALHRNNVKKIAAYLVLLAVLAFCIYKLELGSANRQFRALMVPMGINIMLALSLNLVVGFLGELSLGHAAFMSIGAYSGCLLSIQLQDSVSAWVRLPVCLLFGGLAAALFGLIIGIPVLRLKGDYVAIITLAFGEIIRSLLLNLNDLIGPAGILKNIPTDIVTKKGQSYLIIFAAMAITLIVIINLVFSRQGRAITAIRDNRIAAESIGISITNYKLLVFVVAAFFAGVAGVLYGHNIGQLEPGRFDYNRSIEILVIVVLGGMGSLVGSILSAIIITWLPEVLRSVQDYRLLIYAVVLILMMLINNSPALAALKQRSKEAVGQGLRKAVGRFRRPSPEGGA